MQQDEGHELLWVESPFKVELMPKRIGDILTFSTSVQKPLNSTICIGVQHRNDMRRERIDQFLTIHKQLITVLLLRNLGPQ